MSDDGTARRRRSTAKSSGRTGRRAPGKEEPAQEASSAALRSPSEAPLARFGPSGVSAQAAWAGKTSQHAGEAAVPVPAAEARPAVTHEAAGPAAGEPGRYGHRAAPWFDGPQAPWAGEAPPAGIYISMPLASPADEGDESILLAGVLPPGYFADQLHQGALISLVSTDFRLSEAYVVKKMEIAAGAGGRTRVWLSPRVRAADAGAEQAKTRGQPVPAIALGARPRPWRGSHGHPDREPGPVHEIPGPHARLGWGNASTAITGTE